MVPNLRFINVGPLVSNEKHTHAVKHIKTKDTKPTVPLCQKPAKSAIKVSRKYFNENNDINKNSFVNLFFRR